jgi:hypothetical protein
MMFRFITKYGKPFLDLAIVITGVTAAFLLSNWSTQKSVAAERMKVLTSLQRELKLMCDLFPGMSAYQVKMSKSWDSLHRIGKISDFHHYYYLQPQYNYSVIEYAINTSTNEVVDFQLYEQLILLYRNIKMLEESEVYMTRLALEYRPDENDSTQVSKTNLFLFDRFIRFSRNRAKMLSEINQVASKVLVMVDGRIVAK